MAPSRAAQKAQAKYGVTSDYLDLQLHSAAANGNVGLVKYALMQGQPVNSVLNGVLPIHVAAAAGNEHVVQMLIDAGADVNAARLPRKYTTDKSKAVNSIGETGSTALHFAAANGHANVATLLLSCGANPDATEKHGLTAEDVAREHGQINVLTVLKLWKQPPDQAQASAHASTSALGTSARMDSDNISITPSVRSIRTTGSPTRSLRGGSGTLSPITAAGTPIAEATAIGHATRRLLGKPSLDSLSNKGKKLAKATISAPYSAAANISRSFPAPPPLTLRQNPLKALSPITSQSSSSNMLRQTTSPISPHRQHHIVNLEKGRRPSLPSVFEKATNPLPNIRTALGMTPTSSSFGLSRPHIGGNSSKVNDPYHFGKAKRSSSRTSLSSVFRSSSSRDRNGSEPTSQPLSPAASSFFTGDDELETADREAFLRADRDRDRDVSSGDETYLTHLPPYGHYRSHQQYHSEGQHSGSSVGGSASVGQGSLESLQPGRSRAGSGSSAATTGSGRSYSARGSLASYMHGGGMPSYTSSSYGYPVTAPPTQTGFFLPEHAAVNSVGSSLPRPRLSPTASQSSGSGTGNIVIPAPIAPPPSPSTQPFFSKAAITAAHHSGNAIGRTTFYRPRKSSHLSAAASNASDGERESADVAVRNVASMPSRALHDFPVDENDDAVPLAGPAVVIRRPTVIESTAYRSQRSAVTTPLRDTSAAESKDPASITVQGINRHFRSASDGNGTPKDRASPMLGSPASGQREPTRKRSSTHQAVTGNNDTRSLDMDGEELDAETAHENRDAFPTDQARPFPMRSPTGSRARVDSTGSSLNTTPLASLVNTYTSPTLSLYNANLSPHNTPQTFDGEASWSAASRPYRSGSIGTDTRTSRSGSTGEGAGLLHRYLEYSSSPASVSSLAYQTSQSTTATSLISSPPHTLTSNTASSSATPSESGTRSVTHAEVQDLVRKREQDLLDFDSGDSHTQPLGHRQETLSEQLAAYAESLSIERQFENAARNRHSLDQPLTMTISDTPAMPKYSWEILGKETRKQAPINQGQRISDAEARTAVQQQQQRMWTHKMVSPFEAPLARPAGSTVPRNASGASTVSVSGVRIVPQSAITDANTPSRTYSEPQAPISALTKTNSREAALNSKASTISINNSLLAPPGAGSDLSATRSHKRLPSTSPSGKSPRSSSEKDRIPSTSYHVVAGSEPNDSANSSLVSEPRSYIHLYKPASNLSIPRSVRHRHSKSDPSAKPPAASPELALDDTPKQSSHLTQLEPVLAPKFHIEPKAGGAAAPSPTRHRFSNKIGKLFK